MEDIFTTRLTKRTNVKRMRSNPETHQTIPKGEPPPKKQPYEVLILRKIGLCHKSFKEETLENEQ